MINNTKLIDKEFVTLLKQKNEKALNSLYDQYAPLIYGFLLKEVKSEGLSNDILKNTFINVINECKSIDCTQQSFFTWILLIMKKTAADDFEVNLNFRPVLPENSNNKVHYTRN